jgi:hypothetical protein
MRVERWRLNDAIVTVAACSLGLAFVAIVVPQPLPSVLRPSGMAFPAYIGVDPRVSRSVASPAPSPTEASPNSRTRSRPDVRYALSGPATEFWALTAWSGGLQLPGSHQPIASHGGPAPAPGHGTSPPPGSGGGPSPVPSPVPTASPTQRPVLTTTSPAPTPPTETSSPPPPTDSPPPPSETSPPPTEDPSPTDSPTDTPPPETSTEPPPPEASFGS